MTPDQFDKVIELAKFATVVAGLCTPIVVFIWKRYEFLAKQAKENSLGETKAHQFEEIIRDLKSSVKELTSQVERLRTGYQELMDRITDNYFGAKKAS